MLPIADRRSADQPLKNAAHYGGTAETALVGNLLQAAVGFLQAPARGLDAQPLDELRRRETHLAAEDAGKVARAHAGAFRQHLDRQRLVDVLEHPRLELVQRVAVARLQ